MAKATKATTKKEKQVEAVQEKQGTVKFLAPKAPFLYVGELGVQFKNGEYTTADATEIAYLRKLHYVTEG